MTREEAIAKHKEQGKRMAAWYALPYEQRERIIAERIAAKEKPSDSDKQRMADELNEVGRTRWQGTRTDEFGHVEWVAYHIEDGYIWCKKGSRNPTNGSVTSGMSYALSSVRNGKVETWQLH